MTILPYSINKREAWNRFVDESKQGTFLLDRNFMDYHADRFFDCSLLVYNDEVTDVEENYESLIALFPANWREEEKTVYSHQGLTYGGLITKASITQAEVIRIMQKILMYYEGYLGAKAVVYKPIPYIYSRVPSQEDLYALFRAGAQLESRGVATVVSVSNPLNMRTLRIRQAKKALEQVAFHKSVIAESEKMLEVLNPQYAENKKQARTISDLERRQADTDKKLDTILGILQKLDSPAPSSV